eukprot:scaffold4_cov396-Prasinococcus_capsulatus_cf.AAC.8
MGCPSRYFFCSCVRVTRFFSSDGCARPSQVSNGPSPPQPTHGVDFTAPVKRARCRLCSQGGWRSAARRCLSVPSAAAHGPACGTPQRHRWSMQSWRPLRRCTASAARLPPCGGVE